MDTYLSEMTKYVPSKSGHFKYRGPLTDEDFQRLLITGGSGAFRQAVADSGEDPKDLFMGTVVTANKAGAITGARAVTCGTISGVEINVEEIWKDSKYPGKVIVDDHDASLYTDGNGVLTTAWNMEIPWKVKLNIDDKWKTIKQAKLKDMGLSQLSFRLNKQPVSDQVVKLFLGMVPLSIEELRTRGDAGSRFFPMVKVTQCQAKLWPGEENHHKFGIGVQPLILLEDVDMNESGYLILEGVVWPRSQEVKDKQAALLQTGSVPNYHLSTEKWMESVTRGNFERRGSTLQWPTPRREDEETEESDAFVDTDGELVEKYLLCVGS